MAKSLANLDVRRSGAKVEVSALIVLDLILTSSPAMCYVMPGNVLSIGVLLLCMYRTGQLVNIVNIMVR